MHLLQRMFRFVFTFGQTFQPLVGRDGCHVDVSDSFDSPPCGAQGWSAVCYCGISCSYSLTFSLYDIDLSFSKGNHY